MKIYVSHSKNFDYKKELYEVLEAANLNQEFIFPHKDSNTSFNTKDLLQNKKCDLVLAEVSYPATGQGIELGWADIYQIPIICIYKNQAKIAGSLKIISNTFMEYENTEDLILKLNSYFKHYSK
jgi:nucleoside 2-deoxyribosyltransferase